MHILGGGTFKKEISTRVHWDYVVSIGHSFFSKLLNIVKAPITDIYLTDVVDWVDAFLSYWNIYWLMLRAQRKVTGSKLPFS